MEIEILYYNSSLCNYSCLNFILFLLKNQYYRRTSDAVCGGGSHYLIMSIQKPNWWYTHRQTDGHAADMHLQVTLVKSKLARACKI